MCDMCDEDPKVRESAAADFQILAVRLRRTADALERHARLKRHPEMTEGEKAVARNAIKGLVEIYV